MSKIFMTGGIGAGKTYSAKLMADNYNMAHVSLDEIFFDLKSTNHRERKRQDLRDMELSCALNGHNAIYEGWFSGEWLAPLFSIIDLVVFIETPIDIRISRIKERYRRRKCGLEFDPYPNGGEEHLNNLIKWTALYSKEKIRSEIMNYNKNCSYIEISGDIKNSILIHILELPTRPFSRAGFASSDSASAFKLPMQGSHAHDR